MAQEFYLFVFFCLGFIIFRSDVLQGLLRRGKDEESEKKGSKGASMSFYSVDTLREDFAQGRFEAILEGWALLEDYTFEAFSFVVFALMKLDRTEDVGIFVAKTVANLPDLRASLTELVSAIAS